MITTSEVAISLTLDDISHLKEITAELQKLGKVEVDHYLSIICIVGNSIMEEKQVLNKIIDSVEEFPLRMVSYGGSKHNVSLLVDGKHKNQALQCLNNGLFDFS